ncbi:hypothetical protein ACP90_11240 [Labrenzia sp. CP4]|nr:hypothetical protein ACP90_11240 [Labrenzia sp. CP4]
MKGAGPKDRLDVCRRQLKSRPIGRDAYTAWSVIGLEAVVARAVRPITLTTPLIVRGAVATAVARRGGVARGSCVAWWGRIAGAGSNAEAEGKSCRREPPAVILAIALAIFPVTPVPVVIVASVTIVVAAMRVMTSSVVNLEDVRRRFRMRLNRHRRGLEQWQWSGEGRQSQAHGKTTDGGVT